MLSQSPTPSPTNATSPLPSAGGKKPRPGVKRPMQGEHSQQRESKRKKGEFERGIPNKYLVFPDKEETDKSKKVIITQRRRDIVRNTYIISNISVTSHFISDISYLTTPIFLSLTYSHLHSHRLNRYFENSRH